MTSAVLLATISLLLSASTAHARSDGPRRGAIDCASPDDLTATEGPACPFPSPILLAALAVGPAQERPRKGLAFEVKVAEGLLPGPTAGRLLVVLGKPGGPEPYKAMTETGLDAAPILGRDVDAFAPGRVAVVDGTAASFPMERPADVPPDDYRVQAVFAWNPDLRQPSAPGNLLSTPATVRIDPSRDEAITITLDRAIPAEALPPDTPNVKYRKVASKLLGDFHGRPMSLRAAVALPLGFEEETARRYPLRIHIGGFGSRFTEGPRPIDDPDAPRFLTLVLDGAGPLGDPYQVNSANNGPYGDAVVTELIPHVEQEFRGIGTGGSRVLDGGSTGGWVALALQVFYPDAFAGCWSSCADSVDFRDFQLVNIYRDENAYMNRHGFDRPACRDVNGDVRYTMRHELRLENALGRANSWANSGGQWGSWNAAYGPKGADCRPVPLWDPETGRIDREVARHWEAYDLRLVLERGWKVLGPKLRGKLHISMGDADDYFLNNAMHRLEAFLKAADPPADASVAFGPGQGHCWSATSGRAMLDEMARAVSRAR